MDPVEQELRKMAEDPDTPAHLKLGALKQLVALRTAGAATESSSPSPGVVPPRSDGLPTDPLSEQLPGFLTDEDGRPVPPDPMADLDWEGIVGRPEHALYARVLHTCPWHPTDLMGGYKSLKDMHRGDEAKTLRDAEARFLREARNRGFDTDPDEVADVRRRRRRSRGGS